MATKNRFAISTVFDFDDRPFNRGVDSVTRKTEKLGNDSKHVYHKMFREANKSAQKTERAYSDMFRGIAGDAGKLKGNLAGILGGAGVGALLSGAMAQTVLEDKYRAEAVGLQSEELKQFTLIAKQAGLETDNVTDLFEEMHNKLGMAKKGIYEAGLKDFGLATNLDRAGLDSLLSLDVEDQFDYIISELDKLDLQAAIGIGDSLFGGEFNRFYRSYRTNYDDLDEARKAWETINNLTEEGREGNERYAKSINVLQTSLLTALQDVTGKVGAELYPFVDSFTDAFNGIYQNSDQIISDIFSNLDIHLTDSSKDVVKWAAGITAAIGGVYASYKVAGKILGGSKSILQKTGIAAPDIQKVFVVNMPASGLDSPSGSGSGSSKTKPKAGGGRGPKTRGLTSTLLKGAFFRYASSMAGALSVGYGASLMSDFSPVKWGSAEERDDRGSFWGFRTSENGRLGIDQDLIPKKAGVMDVVREFLDLFEGKSNTTPDMRGSEFEKLALMAMYGNKPAFFPDLSVNNDSAISTRDKAAEDAMRKSYPSPSVVVPPLPIMMPDPIQSGSQEAEQLGKVNRSLERLIDLQEQNMISHNTDNRTLSEVSTMPTGEFNEQGY